jgi:hydroxypyruvate isomerase
LIYTALNIEEKDMIKLAVNLSMIFTEVPLIERFALARAQGFNHVEIQFPYELTIGQIQNQLSTHQLNLCLINVPAGDLMQGGHGLAGIPGQEIEFRHAVEQAIQYATALNVPRVNILAGKQPLDCDLLPCLNTLASNLKMACSMLLEHQIEPVFEMINGTDMPRFLIQNIAQAQEMLEAVHHPALKMQYDCYHMAMTGLALAFGWVWIAPVGGGDMPVVVSLLNSFSGWAAAGIGFTLENNMLIVAGSLVGSSGAILSYIMCKAMNRSIINVLFGGAMGGAAAPTAGAGEQVQRNHRSGSADDAGFLMSNADSVVIVPGYGMAQGRAQNAVKELANLLKEQGVTVRFAIHPVAGRMPGHMNVLLAEADVPYEDILEMDEINSDFPATDVVLVIGANDVVNPAAKDDPTSPIYGMPILEAHKARTIMVIKRSMATGYAGLDNDLFYNDKTMMIFGDAKKVVEDMTKAINGTGH